MHEWARASALVVLLASGCVDTFSGSSIELYLSAGSQVPGDSPSGGGRPPSDTHYEIYVTRDAAVFHLFDFEIRPYLSLDAPCFIEIEEDRFPGLHSTKSVEKLTQVAMSDGTVTDLEAGDIATARVRVGQMPLLADALKVMIVHEPGLTDAVIAGVEAPIPTPDLTDEASNAQRLAMCRAIWAAHPGYYVGTDKVTSLPLNGNYIGMIEGSDPRNNAMLGGGRISVDAALPEFDAMRINWNFNDPNDPRRAQQSPSNIGWHYMAGRPYQRARGVINVTLKNNDFSNIAGEVAVFTDLNDDPVHF